MQQRADPLERRVADDGGRVARSAGAIVKGDRLALGAGVAATARDDERAVLLVAALRVLLADEPAGRAARLEGAPEPGAAEREGEA